MIRSLAESARVSNLPTVWTNTLLGAALAGWGAAGRGNGPEPAASAGGGAVLIALLATSLLYLGGMLLNDAADAAWDREHKPARPIAAGRLSARLVGSLSMLLLLGGVGIASAAGPAAGGVAGVLLASIVLYNWTHKKTRWAVVFMAACRALLYPLAALMISESPAWPIWPASAAVGVYTLLLTLAARSEDRHGEAVSALLGWSVPVPVLVAGFAYPAGPVSWRVLAGVMFVAWCGLAARDASRGRVGRAVTAWLAGFCLADVFMLCALGRPGLAAVASAAWLVTVIGHRWVPGT